MKKILGVILIISIIFSMGTMAACDLSKDKSPEISRYICRMCNKEFAPNTSDAINIIRKRMCRQCYKEYIQTYTYLKRLI